MYNKMGSFSGYKTLARKIPVLKKDVWSERTRVVNFEHLALLA